VGSADLAKHAPEVPDLNESRAHREVDAGTDEQVEEDVAIQDVAQWIDQLRLNEVQISILDWAALNRRTVNEKC
jgi:hypothetical protein